MRLIHSCTLEKQKDVIVHIANTLSMRSTLSNPFVYVDGPRYLGILSAGFHPEVAPTLKSTLQRIGEPIDERFASPLAAGKCQVKEGLPRSRDF